MRHLPRYFWPFMVLVNFATLMLIIDLGTRLQRHRTNAMDLCAWHARRMNGDDPTSEQATQLWREIISGKRVCPFCGQRHDSHWVSRNAWESQVNAMEEKLNGDH